MQPRHCCRITKLKKKVFSIENTKSSEVFTRFRRLKHFPPQLEEQFSSTNGTLWAKGGYKNKKSFVSFLCVKISAWHTWMNMLLSCLSDDCDAMKLSAMFCCWSTDLYFSNAEKNNSACDHWSPLQNSRWMYIYIKILQKWFDEKHRERASEWKWFCEDSSPQDQNTSAASLSH